MEGRGVECGPEGGVVEVRGKLLEEGGRDGQFAALEFMPGAVGRAAGDGVVYPAWWDGMFEFVVQDCLEGGDDLW